MDALNDKLRRKKRFVPPIAESGVAPPNGQCQYYRMGKEEDEFNHATGWFKSSDEMNEE